MGNKCRPGQTPCCAKLTIFYKTTLELLNYLPKLDLIDSIVSHKLINHIAIFATIEDQPLFSTEFF